MWSVYVIRSLKNKKYYIGQTSDLKKRLQRHNSGGNIYTRHRGPFELIYSEEFNNRIDAVAREKKIKSWKGGSAFKKLIK